LDFVASGDNWFAHGNDSTESAFIAIYDYLLAKEFSVGGLSVRPALATS
jgi:hypothetical protein